MLSFSPYARICEVPVEEVFDSLLYLMYRWGHIKCFRFDNGRPFGDPKRETLSPCALNLIARGCQVMFNPPRRPRKNSKVERSQGTTGRWSDAKSCQDIEAFRVALDYAVIAQRERLKTRVCNKKTRAEYYPQLFTNPRRYNSQDFDIQRVLEFLKKGQWYRTVSQVGQVNMFAKTYQVGYPYRNQRVAVRMEVHQQKPHWCFYDDKKVLLRKCFAENIANETYFNLTNILKNSCEN